MKILLVYETVYPDFIGGVESRNYELAAALRRRGHEVTLAGFRKPGTTAAEPRRPVARRARRALQRRRAAQHPAGDPLRPHRAADRPQRLRRRRDGEHAVHPHLPAGAEVRARRQAAAGHLVRVLGGLLEGVRRPAQGAGLQGDRVVHGAARHGGERPPAASPRSGSPASGDGGVELVPCGIHVDEVAAGGGDGRPARRPRAAADLRRPPAARQAGRPAAARRRPPRPPVTRESC